VSGDVEVRAAEPVELSVSTTSGDIRVEGAVVNVFEARTVSGDIEFEAGFAAGPLHTIETVSGNLSIESSTGVTVDVKRGMDLRRGGSAGMVAGDGAARVRFRTLSGDCHVLGARDLDEDREDRHGRRDRRERRLERRLERQAEHMAREITRDRGRVPGVPSMPPMPPMPPSIRPMPPMTSTDAASRRDPWDPAPPPAQSPRSAPERAAVDQLEVLRALERGEIDIEEAARRLQEA
jgi:hypothetical protein